MFPSGVMKKPKISALGILSYILSLIYLIIFFFFNESFANYIFIGIHLFVVGLGVTVFSLIYLVILISYFSKKMKEKDKKNMTEIMKTSHYRVILGISYWAAPLGMYYYYLTESSYLYIFKWLPFWYPLVFYFTERWIIKKEIKINSQVLKHIEKEKVARYKK